MTRQLHVKSVSKSKLRVSKLEPTDKKLRCPGVPKLLIPKTVYSSFETTKELVHIN